LIEVGLGDWRFVDVFRIEFGSDNKRPTNVSATILPPTGPSVNGAFWLPTIAPFSMRYALAVDSAKMYAHSGALPAKLEDIDVMGVASVASPVAFPIRI